MVEFSLFNCKCGEIAKWLVWYKDCGNLYNYRCTKHAALDLEQLTIGTDAYPVVYIRSIDDAINRDKSGQGLKE